MSVPLPEEIRRTGQVIPTPKLVAWAKEAGFVVRRSKGGTSHITYWHQDYPDISNTFIATSDKVASQREFAKTLEEVQRRQLSDSFKATSEKNREILDRVPDHLHARFDHKTGSLVITDRQLPQLGVTVAPDRFHLIDNIIHNVLEPEKRTIFAMMNQARTQYDITLAMPKRGTFDGILSHGVYSLEPLVIPPYQSGDDPYQCTKMIDEYMKTVEAKDREHTNRVDKILGMSFVQEISVVAHARRGDRTFVIHYESPKHRDLSIAFHGYTHQRVSPEAKTDVHHARVSETELAGLERRLYGIAHGHAQAAYEAAL